MKKLLGGLSIFALTTGVAFGQAKDLPNSAPSDVTKSAKRPQGLTHMGNVTAGLNLSNHSKVPGQAEGTATVLSMGAEGKLWYITGGNEFRATLNISEVLTRTPSLEDVNQLTSDSIKLQGLYLYNLPSLPWISPYAMLTAETNLFENSDYRSDNSTEYTISSSALSDPQPSTTGNPEDNQFKLLDPFGLIKLKASLGGLAKLWNQTEANIEARVGIGAEQILSDDGLVIVDDDSTDAIEVSTLEDVTKIGIDALLTSTGQLSNGMISYTAYAGLFAPFYSDPEGDSDWNMVQKTSTEIGANVSFNIVEWAALTYDWKRYRDPFIHPNSQISHTFLASVSFGYDSLSK